MQFISTLLLAWPLLGGASAPEYVLDITDANRVEAVLTYESRFDNLKAKEWILFGAVAPELSGQTGVKSRFEPGGKLAKDLSPLERPIFQARVPATKGANAKSVSIRITYQAKLRARHLRALKSGEKAPVVANLSPNERKAALLKYGDFDLDAAPFQKWLKANKLARGPQESDLDFGRRVFLTIKGQMTYVYTPQMDIHASAVCQAGKSDCGGMAVLFVSTLRAQGIPARTLYGRWAQSAKPGEKLGGSPYFQWHVKAEFFARGVGWVPVDVSSAVLYDKTKAGLTYFGHDSGDFFTQHIDSNFEVDTAAFGRQKIENLQQPVLWVTGAGTTDLRKDTEGWQVRTLP